MLTFITQKVKNWKFEAGYRQCSSMIKFMCEFLSKLLKTQTYT